MGIASIRRLHRSHLAELELWREVTRTTLGLTGIVEAIRQTMAPSGSPRSGEVDAGASEELVARAERQTDVVAVARLEGQARAKDGGTPPPGCGRVAPGWADVRGPVPVPRCGH